MDSMPVLNQSLTSNIKQMQRLMMLPQMQQAMHLLQMPILELSTLVETLQVQNPIFSPEEDANDAEENEEDEQEENEEDLCEKSLSFNDKDFTILQRLDEDFRYVEGDSYVGKRTAEEEEIQNYKEQSIQSRPSLFEHLMQQAQETFGSSKELTMSESIIGNLSVEGYLKTTLEEISIQNDFPLETLRSILKEIQKFTPYGTGASSLQESLHIQLHCLGKQNSIAAKIIEEHFEDLLKNNIMGIQKHLGIAVEEITNAISNDIAHLDLHPGTSYARDAVQQIVPDVTLQQDGEDLRIVINDDFIPSLHLNSRYMRLMEDPNVNEETKDFIHTKLSSAKWLIKNIYQRNETLEKMVRALVKRQKNFFIDPAGKLEPLTMKQLAEEIEVHESTVARAVANKYLDCPRGLVSLRSFFNNAYVTNEGTDISSETVRDALSNLIQKENQLHPHSDEALSKQLKALGITCARRTVAKYREELKIGNAHQRRKFK